MSRTPNPQVVADEHGDAEELLAKLEEAEREAARLGDQLKAILEEGAAVSSCANWPFDTCSATGNMDAIAAQDRDREILSAVAIEVDCV